VGRVGSLLDFALRQRCWQNLLCELWQEIRPVGLGMKDRLLVVAHTDEGETIRMISARLVTKQERRIYEEGES
jgi:uncharacterized DUF497 family protein